MQDHRQINIVCTFVRTQWTAETCGQMAVNRKNHNFDGPSACTVR